jgi:transposase-like protein
MVESHNDSEAGHGGTRRRRRDASQWRALIEQQRASVQTVKAFCAEHGLGQASFYAWRRHLRRQAKQPSEAPEQATPQPSQRAQPSTGFVRLDPQADASSDAIEVRFACGTTLRCASSHLPELVRLLKSETDEVWRC